VLCSIRWLRPITGSRRGVPVPPERSQSRPSLVCQPAHLVFGLRDGRFELTDAERLDEGDRFV